jgi:hypothetical protein
LYDPNVGYGSANLQVGNYFIRLGPLAAEKNNGVQVYYADDGRRVDVMGDGEGIQCVAEIVQHEQIHISFHRLVHDPAWHDPNLSYDDNDRDGVLDVHEPTLMGIATDPGDPDTYRVAIALNWPKYATYGDNEFRAQLNMTKLTFQIYPEKDWANPGCQHANQYGPRVNP